MTADEVLITQAYAAELPLPRRIAYWAGRFIGTPYDPDPLGLYVRTNRIVADEAVDCMYHTFRSAELAMTTTPADASRRRSTSASSIKGSSRTAWSGTTTTGSSTARTWS
jgi:hypothetical protein